MKIRSKYDNIEIDIKWNGKSKQFQKIINSKKIKPNTYLIIRLTESQGYIENQLVDNKNIDSILITSKINGKIKFKNVTLDDTNIRTLKTTITFSNVRLNHSHFIFENALMNITRSTYISNSKLEIRNSCIIMKNIKKFILYNRSKMCLYKCDLDVTIDENKIKQNCLFNFMCDRFERFDFEKIILDFNDVNFCDYLRSKHRKLKLTNLNDDQCILKLSNEQPDIELGYSFIVMTIFIFIILFVFGKR